MKQGKVGERLRSEFVVRLRRMLSAHEIAVLLVLSSAPVEFAVATPDFTELQSIGLVRVVGSHFTLTETGSAVLQRLKTFP